MKLKPKFAFALITLAAVFSLHSGYAYGQSDGEVTIDDLTGHLDLSIPESPAFTILGLSPESVTKGDDFRTVATTLLHGLDQRGNLQSGIALDVRPFLSLSENKPTIRDYRDSKWIRIASKAQLSFATASGKDDSDKADRQALGLNLTLWMENDPAKGNAVIQYKPIATTPGDRIDAETRLATGTVDECFADYLKDASAAPAGFPPPDEMDAAEEAIAKKARQATSRCIEPFKKAYWNSGSLVLSVAGYRGKVNDIDQDGFGISLGYSHSLGRRGQIIFRAAIADNQLQPVEGQQGEYMLVDQTDLGARFRWGSDRGSVMLEGAWTDADTPSGSEDYSRAAIGTEFVVGGDIWLQFSVGKAFGTDMFDDNPVYSGQVRFGFSESSLFGSKK